MIEIDGVRLQLEKLIWESGDYISDEWLKLIDYATHPEQSSEIVLNGLASAVRRLNRNLTTTSFLLRATELAPVYNDVIAQVNSLNSGKPVDVLDPLVPNASFSDASGSFKFAHS